MAEKPEAVSKEDLRKQKIVARITELKIILQQQDDEMKTLQITLQETTAKLQQMGANMNFTNGALAEKQKEFDEFEI